MTQQLRIPGPTPLPDRVVRAMAKPMIDHRGPEMAAMLQDVAAGAKLVFGTADADVLVLTSSGTGAMESAVANLVEAGDKVIVATAGVFGDRFVDINNAWGASVVKVAVDWGQPIADSQLEAALEANPDAKAVFLTHNETSTGMTNPLQRLAAAVTRRGAAAPLLVVDAISSASSMPVEMDAWGLDVVLSGSQKGWMAPPGIAFAAIGPRAMEVAQRTRSPRYYFDWRQAKKNAEAGSTPWTPAVSVLFAVQEGIRMMEEEGLPTVYARHRRLADATEAGLAALGLELFAADGFRSATVTSALPMPGLDVSAFRKLLRTRYGVVIAGGQGKMTGKMVRVGHLGAVTDGDVVQVLWAMERALEELDIAPADGRAIAAATPHLAEETVGTPA